MLMQLQFLGEEDMWSLPPNDSAEALSNRLATSWQKQLDYVKAGQKKKASLKIAIARAYGGPYLVAGILKATYDSISFLQPQLLRLLLRFVSSYGTDNPLPPVAGYGIAIMMFVSANVGTAMLHQYFDRCFATSRLPPLPQGTPATDFMLSYAGQGRSGHLDLPKIAPTQQWREGRASYW